MSVWRERDRKLLTALTDPEECQIPTEPLNITCQQLMGLVTFHPKFKRKIYNLHKENKPHLKTIKAFCIAFHDNECFYCYFYNFIYKCINKLISQRYSFHYSLHNCIYIFKCLNAWIKYHKSIHLIIVCTMKTRILHCISWQLIFLLLFYSLYINSMYIIKQ